MCTLLRVPDADFRVREEPPSAPVQLMVNSCQTLSLLGTVENDEHATRNIQGRMNYLGSRGNRSEKAAQGMILWLKAAHDSSHAEQMLAYLVVLFDGIFGENIEEPSA